MDKEFSSLNIGGESFLVKDATARKKIENLYFNTVAEMKNAPDLVVGETVKTLGYHEINDNGSGLYIIKERTNDHTEDNGFIHFIGANLIAELLIENNTINFKQLGAKSEQDTNFAHLDCKEYLGRYLSWIKNNPTKYLKLLIPSGIWCFSETLINIPNVNIVGEKEFFENGTKTVGTIITAISNQKYVWKLGGNIDFNYDATEYPVRHINISDCTFSSGLYDSIDVPDSLYEIEKAALYVDNMCFSYLNNLDFNFVYGTGLAYSSSWELYTDKLNFRRIYNHAKPCLLFDKVHNIKDVSSPNLSAIEIGSIMFEVCNGDLIKIENGSALDNCHIKDINGECSFTNGYQENGTIGTASTSINPTKHNSVLNIGTNRCLIIDNINLQLIGGYYHTVGNETYVMDRLINFVNGNESNPIYTNTKINNILYELNKIPVYVVYQECNYIASQNQLVIDTIQTDADGTFGKPLFNLTKFRGLNINDVIAMSRGNYQKESKLTNEVYIPFYRINWCSWDDSTLVSDSESVNKLNICTKRFDGNKNVIVGYLPSFKPGPISMLVKIPEGETAQFMLMYTEGGTQKTKYTSQHTGTGAYTWYDVDLTDIPADVNSYLRIGTSSKNALFDLIKL